MIDQNSKEAMVVHMIADGLSFEEAATCIRDIFSLTPAQFVAMSLTVDALTDAEMEEIILDWEDNLWTLGGGRA